MIPASIPAVILAGGQSRRFGGGDKGLAVLAGRPLLAHIVDRLGGENRAVALNANGDTARFAAFGLPVLPDEPPDFAGPLAGILAALRWGRALGAEAVLTVPGDAPFLPRDLTARLSAARQGADITYAASAGRRHFVTALWPVRSADALARHLASGQRRVEDWMAQQTIAEVVFETSPVDPFLNINTRTDLAEAEAIMARVDDQG